jgi:hypothetical protein
VVEIDESSGSALEVGRVSMSAETAEAP